MRIPCPFCGERDLAEFAYLGDAKTVRPNTEGPEAQSLFVDAVYFRDNPDGVHCDLWYHGSGCRSWLRVTRHTRTHEIFSVELAKSGGGA